jgi:hypothetical protein
MKLGQQELGVYPLWVGLWVAAIIIAVLMGQT